MANEKNVTLRDGSKMPAIGLGTWQLRDMTFDVVSMALDLGYRMIDTSSDYGSHAGISEALETSSVGRSELFLVIKVEVNDNAYTAIQLYLDELNQDYTDLVLIHHPPRIGSGESLWQGLIRAREEGLTKHIGVSNYSVALIEQLIKSSGEVPVVNQVEWTPFGHSERLQNYCKDRHIVIQAYSPLTLAKRLDNEEIVSIAARHKKSSAQVLLRWQVQRGTVPIPKATSEEHLKENISIFDFELSKDEMERLNGLNEGYSSLAGLTYV